MASWKVDLPKLSPSAQVDDTSAIQFLVSSRVTFAVTEFFQIMSDFDKTNDPDLMTKVEGICHQVDDLYSEWKIVGSHHHLHRKRQLTQEIRIHG